MTNVHIDGDNGDVVIPFVRRERNHIGAELAAEIVTEFSANTSLEILDGNGSIFRSIAGTVDGEARYPSELLESDALLVPLDTGLSSYAEITSAISNPDGENGVTGWTNDIGTLTTRSASPPPYAGTAYFQASTNNSATKASQEIDLVAAGLSTSDIDNGILSFWLTWRQASFAANNDQGALAIGQSITSGGTLLRRAKAREAVISDGAGNYQVWKYRQLLAAIRPATRYATLFMEGTRLSGTALDFYVDDIRLFAGEAAAAGGS